LEVSIKANKVSARFKVENKSVKKSLSSNMDQLKQSIQQIGLDVDSVDVSDMSSENGGTEENWFDDSSGNARGDGRGQNTEEEENATQSTHPPRRNLRQYSTIELVA
jgi:flagellar hook-length control protein FliK